MSPLLSLAMRPLPLAPLQVLLHIVIGNIRSRHAGIFERLGPHARKTYGLDPTDLPFAFVLEPGPECPRMRAVRRLPLNIDVRIAGRLAALTGLVDGAYDGDVLFFSRDLVVEGDVEALLALRNAIDDSRIDLAREAACGLGPLAPKVETAIRSLLRRPHAAEPGRTTAQWN